MAGSLIERALGLLELLASDARGLPLQQLADARIWPRAAAPMQRNWTRPWPWPSASSSKGSDAMPDPRQSDAGPGGQRPLMPGRRCAPPVRVAKECGRFKRAPFTESGGLKWL